MMKQKGGRAHTEGRRPFGCARMAGMTGQRVLGQGHGQGSGLGVWSRGRPHTARDAKQRILFTPRVADAEDSGSLMDGDALCDDVETGGRRPVARREDSCR